MRFKQTFTLYKKEMLDLLRDKKTIIVMILVPVFLYPVMMIISLFVMQGVAKETASKEYRVAFIGNKKSAEEVYELLMNPDDEYDYSFKKEDYVSLEKAKEDLTDKQIDLIIVTEPVYVSDILSGEDGVKNTDPDQSEYLEEYLEELEALSKEGALFSVDFYDLSSNTSSLNAYQYASKILEGYSEELRDQTLVSLFGESEAVLRPIPISVESISSKEENAGSLIGMMLPFILVISVLAGAIYPAIDATAGERERGTLETVMTLPVKRTEIMFSKFLSVSTIAVFSAILNLISMFAVTLYMFMTMDLSGFGLGSFDFKQFVPAVISLFVCLPVFAMFTSAVSLCVCIYAKSFKEANNITSPILMIFMFASMAGIIPTVELSPVTAMIPVTNIALLIKSVFSLDYDIKLVAIVLFSNLAYCVLLVMMMSFLFSSENILFGESLNGVSLFETRANIRKGQIPGIGDIIFLFAALMLIMIYSGSFLVLKWGLWGTALVQFIILMVPLLYAVYIRADIKELYSLKMPRIRELLGSVVIWIGCFLLIQTILSLLLHVFPAMQESSDALEGTILGAGFVPSLLVVGFCPAIAEEAAFRGFLFGTLKHRTKIVVAIIVSAALFGLYHMNLLQFVSGFFMGCFMAFMVYKSKSIFTSALFHLLNNSFSVVVSFYPSLLTKIPVLGEDKPGALSMVLAGFAGIVFVMSGLLLFGVFRKNKQKPDS